MLALLLCGKGAASSPRRVGPAKLGGVRKLLPPATQGGSTSLRSNGHLNTEETLWTFRAFLRQHHQEADVNERLMGTRRERGRQTGVGG